MHAHDEFRGSHAQQYFFFFWSKQRKRPVRVPPMCLNTLPLAHASSSSYSHLNSTVFPSWNYKKTEEYQPDILQQALNTVLPYKQTTTRIHRSYSIYREKENCLNLFQFGYSHWNKKKQKNIVLPPFFRHVDLVQFSFGFLFFRNKINPVWWYGNSFTIPTTFY